MTNNSVLKRTIAVLLAVIMGLALISCGAPDEVKQQAEDTLNEYKVPFEDKVKEVYGSGAKLKKAECPVLMNIGSPVPDVTYKVSDHLTGKIIMDGESYDADYYPEADRLEDTVHTNMVLDEIKDSLPINKKSIVTTKYTDQEYMFPKFECTVDTLDKLLESNQRANNITLSIITDEDLSGYSQEQFENIPQLVKLSSCDIYFNVRIVSLKDRDKLSQLTGKIQEIYFSNVDSHPTVYSSETREYVDAYDYYHIRNSIEIRREPARGGEDIFRYYYND